MKQAISVDVRLCTGCRNCELACSVRNTRTFNPKRSRILVLKEEPESVVLPMVCLQCEEPLCKYACPSGAIVENDVGVLAVNHDLCVGCGKCVTACVYGGVAMDPILRKASKCDLCSGDPACLKACEYMAISLVEVSEGGFRARSAGLGALYSRYGMVREEGVQP
jgi:Fe-S-cluster-containing hydrogenase component 2